ncbi:Mobile element protein [hydrothermal vent metagenome]|uniref:Mobile element protein n=1 Tax=hydrothermal vent metagenome TaxID=652676 RepID=A0A3B0VE58_9ZZZZ
MKREDRPWLAEVNAQSLQASLINLDRAFMNFFRKKTKFPRFKKKTDKQSFQVPQRGKIDFENRKLIIPKFQEGIRCKMSRRFEGETKTFTVSKTTTGKYFVSVLVETPEEIPDKQPITEASTIGIDVGIKTFATLSTGEEIENPRLLKEELARLKVLKRRASKKKKGSINRRKAFKKVALHHERIAGRRNDFLHKLTHRLISENQAVAIEDLNIAGMMKNHCLAQAIADVSWSEFFRQLEYKAEWKGKNVLKVGRFEPSSKMCSCGVINTKLTLKDRTWTCTACGITHARDVLAAQNIKRFALLNDNLKNSGQGLTGELSEVRCCNDDR